MAVYDTQGRPVIVDIETAYTAGVMGVGVSTLGNTAGNTGTSTGTVVLAGTNNITVNQSTGAGGATIWIDQTGGAGADGVNIISLSGNTTGTLSSQSTGTVVLAGGANITLSQSSNTISIVGGAGGGAAVSAGTQSQNTGTVIFSNSNGLSFGLDAGTLTASHNALTTAAASNHSHGNPTLNLTNLSGTTASNSAGLTLSLSAAAPGGGVAVAAGTQTATSGTVVLANSGQMSFGMSNSSQITGSVPYIATVLYANGVPWALNSSEVLNFYRMSWRSAGATIHADPLINVYIHNSTGGTSSSEVFPVRFEESGPISIVWSTDRVKIGAPGAALISHSHGNPTLALTNLTGTTASASNGLTLSLSAANPGVISLGVSNLGETAGNTRVTTGRFVFAGNNLTLQQSTAAGQDTIWINGPVESGVGVADSATTYQSNYLTFSNSNRVSFGINLTSPILTASIDAAATDHSHGNPTLNLTNLSGTTASNSAGLTLSLSAAAGGIAASLSGNSTSGGAGYSNVTSGTLILAGGNNITLSQDGSRVTISGANIGGAQTGISGIGASDTTYSSGTVIWSGQNNITVGTSVNGASQYVRLSVGNYLTTAAQSNQVVNLLNGSTGQVSLAVGSSLSSSTNGSTITFGLASNITTALQSAGAYLTTARASNDAVGLNTAATQVTWTVNSSGISLNAGAYLTTAQPPGAYLTTARASNDAVGLNTAATQVTWTVNSSGISLNAGAYLTTAMASNAVTLSNIRVSAGTTSNLLSAVTFANGSGVSFGLNAGTITATVQTNYLTTGAASDHSHGNPQLNLTNLSGTTASASNGFTLSLSAGNYLTTARASNDAIGLNTAATNVTWTVGSAGLSLNAGGYAGTGTSATNASITLNTNGLAISVAAPGAAAENNWINLSGNTAGNTTASGSTIKWYGGNNITLHGTNGSEVSIIGGAGGGGAAVGLSTNGDTSGNTGTFTSGTYVFAGSNSLTLHQSTGGGGVHTLWLKPAMSQLTAGALISLSTNGSTVSVIGLGAGTGTGLNLTNLTGTLSVNTAGVSLSLNGPSPGGGATISRYLPYRAAIHGANTGVSASHSAGAGTSGIQYMYPFVLEANVAVGWFNIYLSENFTTVGNSSGRQTGGLAYAIYVQDTGTNASRLTTTYNSGGITWAVTGNNSSYTLNYPTSSYSNTWSSGATNSAGSNLSSAFTGIKQIALPIGATMTPGSYWLGLVHTLSTSSVNVGLLHSIFGWNMGSSLVNAAPMGAFSSAYTAGSNWSAGFGGNYMFGHGSWTQANNVSVTGSLPISQITNNGFSVMPFMALWSS